METGTELIRQERERQVKAEGWSAAHDDDHALGELGRAAACYALAGVWDVGRASAQALQPRAIHKLLTSLWPPNWDATRWWKPKDKIRNLVRAGALIAAEIDRLQRIEERQRIEKMRRAAKFFGFGDDELVEMLRPAMERAGMIVTAKATRALLPVEEAVARQRRELGMDVTARGPAPTPIEHPYLGHG